MSFVVEKKGEKKMPFLDTDRLYENIEEITIEYKSTHPRVNVKDVKVKITGVYRNFFTVKENKSHIVVEHTVMYVDIITGNFKICSDNQNI